MKKFLITGILLLMPAVLAQNINGRISSSFYTFERFDSPNVSETYVRNFESLYLNVSESKFSLKTRLNFETNISNVLDNDPRLRFYNLYAEARDLAGIATVRLGRQSLFNTVAGGLYDGVNLQLRYNMFKLESFYGANVPAYQKLELTDDWGNDYILGGVLTAYPLDELRVAVSYTDKNFKAQEYDAIRLNEFNVLDTILIKRASNQFKFLAGEISYNYDNVMEFHTEYNYDLNFSQTSKFEFSGRYAQIENLGINFYYNYRVPKIRYNSIFSVFNYRNTQEIEGGLDYKFSDFITAYGKFGTVQYEDDESQRLTVGANTKLGSFSYRKTFGYAGELDAVSVYTAKTFLEGLLTPSVGITYSNYKLSEDDEANNLLAFLGGVNVRPMRQLSFDLQGQFISNKIYNNDFRILFKINHWFNTNLDLL